MAKRQKPGRTTPEPAKSSNAAARDAAARTSTGRHGDRAIRVRVLDGQTGYYDEKRRRSGDVFTYRMKPHEQRLPKWVEACNPATPESITTGTQELRRQHDEILKARTPATGTPVVSDEDQNAAVIGE